MEVTAEVLVDDVGEQVRRYHALFAVGAFELQLHVDAGRAGIALDQHQVGAVGTQDGPGFVDSSGDRLVGEHEAESRFPPMTRDTLQIRLPVAKTPDVTAAPTFTLDRPIRGTRIGIRHEGSWRSWMLIAGEWERFLERDGAEPIVVQTGERVGHEGAETRARVRDWAESIDCAVSGLGTCGSCTSWSVSDAVAVEDKLKPSIVAVTAEFETHAHNMATFLGHPNLKVLVLPYPLEARPADELREIAVEYYPKFLELLGSGT